MRPILTPIKYITVPLTHKNQLPNAPKRHLDRFSCFCTVHRYDQHTERQTDTHTDTQSTPCPTSVAMWPKHLIQQHQPQLSRHPRDALCQLNCGPTVVRIKPGPHQQQCRSNIVECYNVECCFDKVERCFDIVAKNGNIVASVDRA